MKHKIPLTLLILLIATACTNNPFNSGEPIQDRSSFNGTVTFADGSPANGILVWLETFERSTLTDTEGKFTISLPPAQSQPGGGLSGVFRAWIYQPDYQLDTVRVILRDGEILLGQEDISDNGSVSKPLRLQKLFEIETVLIPDGMYRNESISVDCITRIKVSAGKSVEIFSFGDSIASGDPFITAGLLERVNTPSDPFQRIVFAANANHRFSKTTSGTTEFLSRYTFQRCTLLDAQYRIIPFVWARQPNLPPELLDALNVPFETLSLDYLRLPFIERTLGLFDVEPEIIDENLFPCN